MKKNLISILILALLVVNVVLTAIMMFSVTGSAKKTAALVTDIASVLNIELTEKTEEEVVEVSIADLETVDIPDSMTIPLKHGDDGKDHYCIVNATLYLNTKHDDYSAYGATVQSNISLFKSIIIDVISSHTLNEIKDDSESLRAEILNEMQKAYDSSFIYKVTFSNIMYQ